MKALKIAAFGVLPFLAGPVLAQDVRDLSVEQATAAQAGTPHPGTLQVSLAADRADATYAVGESVRLQLTANEDAYVTVLDVGPSGKVTQLFPNAYQTDNHVTANQPVEIGGGNTGAHVTVSGPVGAELIKVIASNKPLNVVSAAQLQGGGAFKSLEGGTSTLTRDLDVVSDQAAQDQLQLAFANVTLHTIANRAAATPTAATSPLMVIVPSQMATAATPTATTILPVVVPAAPVAAGPLAIPAEQPFPLLIAADKPAYRMGEKVTLAVTTLQACNLTVVDITSSGQVHTLISNQTTPNNAVSALQTVLVAGGPSPISLPVSGPAGVEQVLAICSTDPTPVSSVADAANGGGDRASFAKDLSVVAARPAGTTSIASLTFSVLP